MPKDILADRAYREVFRAYGNDTIKLVETDVLIVGSGAAGCGAAIGARKLGARVVSVDLNAKRWLKLQGSAPRETI